MSGNFGGEAVLFCLGCLDGVNEGLHEGGELPCGSVLFLGGEGGDGFLEVLDFGGVDLVV